jgi:hypothetical protein
MRHFCERLAASYRLPWFMLCCAAALQVFVYYPGEALILAVIAFMGTLAVVTDSA